MMSYPELSAMRTRSLPVLNPAWWNKRPGVKTRGACVPECVVISFSQKREGGLT